MNDSDSVWRWVHQKYGMSWIVQILHSFSKNRCTLLAVPEDVQFNQQNNKTYDLQCTNINNNNQLYKNLL